VVIDSSVLINALGDVQGPGERARNVIGTLSDLIAPDVLISETFAGLRGLWIRQKLSSEDFVRACLKLRDFPVEIHETRGLISAALSHRHNVGSGDSLFVSLAEQEGRQLLTSDRRLANATGIKCEVIALV
jgi:predicted nucleic acid-binding protein